MYIRLSVGAIDRGVRLRLEFEQGPIRLLLGAAGMVECAAAVEQPGSALPQSTNQVADADQKEIPDWGVVVDPDGDCSFDLKDSTLTIASIETLTDAAARTHAAFFKQESQP